MSILPYPIVLHPSLVKCLSSPSIRSPQLHRKLWMEQKKAIRAATLIKALVKPTLTSSQAKRVDAVDIKSEDLQNMYISGEHPHGSFPYSLERERGINSKPQWEKLEKALGHTC